jgi:glycosyltransferase involved in cell wall biosynthesis
MRTPGETWAPGESRGTDEGFAIWRRPRGRELLNLVRWCDVFFHNNISLPKTWPLWLVRRPWVVAHHVEIPRTGLAARAKRYALRYAASCISISKPIAAHLDTPSVVIPNPYDHTMFRVIPGVERTRDLIFLGRLVSQKGADLLLLALEKLAREGLRPTVTIVGAGPEESALRMQAEASGLGARVVFAGKRVGEDLAVLLNQHRVLVVPSRGEEAFGLVALEGIAAGCVVVGSTSGGLPEAIGACGETFPNGDAEALAEVLSRILRNPARYEALRAGAESHVRRHTCPQIAADYLRVLRGAAHV